ncbi:hypothetical protein B296_00002081 [Ensete ventricosum]|uniref:Uncharacterized protein n=1 Tax=Ensete ventricosum TaxID=4639 RepID=A0A426YRZ7_ENSVE|nr:hypothetical protein B296_00002081 [Ensete ventricosum]
MAMKGQRDTKNTAIIPSDRTLTDSKFGVISIGDRSTSLELYRGSSLLGFSALWLKHN